MDTIEHEAALKRVRDEARACLALMPDVPPLPEGVEVAFLKSEVARLQKRVNELGAQCAGPLSEKLSMRNLDCPATPEEIADAKRAEKLLTQRRLTQWEMYMSPDEIAKCRAIIDAPEAI